MRLPRHVPRSRRGTVTAWLILSLAVIIAILAIGLDGGRMMEERRHVQAAADAAALAAAADLFANYTANQGSDAGGTAQAAAITSATANGYSNDGTKSVVTVNIPPTAGAFAGQAGYVEIIVRSNLSATFGAAITGSGLTVQARAVARGQPQKLGILLLNASMNGAFSASGSAAVTVSGAASLMVDSTGTQALTLSDNASVQASSINIAGGYASNGNITGSVIAGAPPMADPLRSLQVPGLSNFTVRSLSTLNLGGASTTTLEPGVYQGGIELCGSAAATLQPGLYLLNGGGLEMSGSATLTGNGVTIFNTGLPGGQLKIGGSGNVTLTPPASGPFQGISIFQDRLNNQSIHVFGNGSVQVTGLIYAPGASLHLGGHPSGNTVSGAIIADSLRLWGNASVNVRMGMTEPAVPDCRLVE